MKKGTSSGFGATMKSPGLLISRKNTAPMVAVRLEMARETDPNAHLEMPGGRTASSPDLHWYFANNAQAAVPTGLGDEDAIRRGLGGG